MDLADVLSKGRYGDLVEGNGDISHPYLESVSITLQRGRVIGGRAHSAWVGLGGPYTTLALNVSSLQ